MAGSRKSPSTEAVSAGVAACLKRHLHAQDDVVIGLSGGVDSVVLLHAMRASQQSLSAVHVHHGLNSAADHWAEFCTDLCTAWGIPLSVRQVVVQRNTPDGLEGAARRARHQIFASLPAAWVATGHHRGDRAETLLFNLLRGAGVRGAGALRERSGRLLRPLLAVGRGDILAYAREHALAWVDDDSNLDTRFSRNFLRHSILAEVRGRFPAAEARLASAAERFAEAADLLDELARIDLAGHAAAFPLDLGILAGLPEPRARNILRFLLSLHGVGIPSEERLREALRQFLTAAPDRHPAVSFGGRMLRRRKQQLFLEELPES
jgi:tRNA(Ile)-lysidine synthase